MEPPLVAYMAMLASLTLSPGPLVCVLLARSANRDWRGACAFATGICIANILMILAISAGLGDWLAANPGMFAAGKYVGVVFLLWLAARTWDKAVVLLDRPAPASGTLFSTGAGMAICLGSPPTVIFLLVSLPAVIKTPGLRMHEVTLVLFATILVRAGVFGAIILLSGATRRLLASSTGSAIFGRCSAMAIAVSAIWVLVS